MKKLSFWLFLMIFFCTLPVSASEDGEDYEFDDVPDFSFDTQLDDGEAVPYDVAPVIKDSLDDTTLEKQDDSKKNDEIFIPVRPDISTQPQSKDSQASKSSKGDSLTDKLKENQSNKEENFIDGTWIEKLTEISPSKLLGNNNNDDDNNDKSELVLANTDEDFGDDEISLETMVHNYRGKSKSGRSNASVFDIAGIMLRMSVEQVDYTMQNRGFKRINARFQIPNFIKWRNEEGCRATGVVGYERTQACVVQKAKKDGYEYVQYVKYAKFDTKETMEVYFTSTFSDNKVYKIEYRSTIASITGNSPKAVYIRNLKIYDFWRRISRKYGVPDDKDRVIWGLGTDKPYMVAKTGFLKLEDPMFIEMDYTRMSREDQKFIHSDFYNF